MINYIICDSKEQFLKSIEDSICHVMMHNNMEYETHFYRSYDHAFREIVKQKLSYKIYILNTDVNGVSGFEMARLIREDDVDSILIFCSENYRKYQKDLIKNRFFVFDFIDQKGSFMEELEASIEDAMKQVGKKNAICFKCGNIDYKLPMKDILYIIKNKDRTCTIQMINNFYTVKKTLKSLKQLLDDNFVYSHRACIVNRDRIIQYNHKNKTILFENNMGTDLVSDRFQMYEK